MRYLVFGDTYRDFHCIGSILGQYIVLCLADQESHGGLVNSWARSLCGDGSAEEKLVMALP